MISVAEACDIIAGHVATLDTITLPLADVAGYLLAEPIIAERDQPPFDRVTMDGAAIRWQTPLPALTSQGSQFAGDPAGTLQDGAHAIEIMTGAVLPEGADTIVPVERYTLDTEQRQLRFEPDYAPERGQFIHRRASDHSAGTTLLEPGMRITAAEIAIIASAGRASVSVYRKPRVAVVATGNELVAAGAPIAAHQIRLSNAPAVISAMQLAGFLDTSLHHLPDEPGVLEARIGQLLESHDVLMLSGGVSRGKADHVPDVLARLGVEKQLHRIAQRPGKPMWFGVARNGALVFGLPGNPVSTLCCFRRYVLPTLQRLAGRTYPDADHAVLGADHEFKPALTQFLAVRLQRENDAWIAMPCPTNTSGDFTALAATDGFIELPATAQTFARGETFALYRWPAR